MLKEYNPSFETMSAALRKKSKRVGHWAMARWMKKNGFPFHYAYYIIFNKFLEKQK